LWNKPGSGYSTLTVSPDGTTVSVYSCEGCTGEFRFTDGRNWLAQFDVDTGNRQPDLEIAACRGQTFLGPEGSGVRPVYVVCDRTRQLEMVDLATGQPLELTYDAFLDGGFPETIGANAAVVAPDGRWLYLASGNRLTVIDMTRHAARRVQLADDITVEQRLPLLTLSPDGTQLFVGSIDRAALEAGRAESARVDVFDTTTWESRGQMKSSRPLTNMSLTAALDNTSFYGINVDHHGGEDIVVESRILHLSPDSGTTAIATRTNEEVLFLFARTVEVDPDAEFRPTPTPEPTAHERLFAVNHMLTPTGDAVDSGRVTAYDADTGEIAYWVETGTNPDATLSPDGTRLFIAANSDDGETLSSYDALSGDRNWSVPIENRHMWQFGEGPTALAVSQDGSRLFVYSASGPGDYFIQVFDTADGRLGRVIDGVAGCTAQLFPRPMAARSTSSAWPNGSRRR
jgi:DNA-binding beta-propeller fold protein YncE